MAAYGKYENRIRGVTIAIIFIQVYFCLSNVCQSLLQFIYSIHLYPFVNML